MKRTLPMLISLLMLGGCAGLGGTNAAPKLYVLTPLAKPMVDVPAVRASLVVDRPLASAGLDSERIALLSHSRELDYIAGVRWAEALPRLLQALTVESFENTGKIQSVGSDALGLTPTHVLVLEIRDFQAEYTAASKAPLVKVKIVAKLLSVPGREMLTGFAASVEEQAATDSVTAITEAFDVATTRAAGELVSRTLKALQASPVLTEKGKR